MHITLNYKETQYIRVSSQSPYTVQPTKIQNRLLLASPSTYHTEREMPHSLGIEALLQMWTHGHVNELHITGHGPRCPLESESCCVHAAVAAVRLRRTCYDVHG